MLFNYKIGKTLHFTVVLGCVVPVGANALSIVLFIFFFFYASKDKKAAAVNAKHYGTLKDDKLADGAPVK